MPAATPLAGAWTGGVFDQIALYENGIWQLDLDGDRFVGDDGSFQFGIPGDLPVAGDWNGNGFASVGVFRLDGAGNGLFILDFNDDRVFTGGVDIVARFGVSGDVPVAGNWNGLGGDEIGIFRRGAWAIDTSGNFAWNGTAGGDEAFGYGAAGDVPVVGNWNPGTLRDSVGVRRLDPAGNAVLILDRNENRSFSSSTDVIFRFGTQADRPFAGDFSGDNTDEVGVVTTAFGQETLSITPIPAA